MGNLTEQEEYIRDEAIGRLRPRWIPLKEFGVGSERAYGLQPTGGAADYRRRESQLYVDLLLVSDGPIQLEEDNHELRNYKEWKGTENAYRRFNPDAPSHKSARNGREVFLAEMARLLRDRELVLVEVKAAKSKKSSRGSRGSLQSALFPNPEFIDLYGSHVIFHGLGQALLYYELLKEDFGPVRVRTGVLTNVFSSVERSTYEELVKKLHREVTLPPFNTLLWDTSYSDREFFVER